MQEINYERNRQDEKWGKQNDHSIGMWMQILMEEVGEAAHAGLEHEDDNLREELIQVAAVAVSIIEHIDAGFYFYE